MVVHQEVDCFLAADSGGHQQHQHSFIDFHRVLADDGAVKKISFDVALDTDDLCSAWRASSGSGIKHKGKSLFPDLELELAAEKKGRIQQQRKIGLRDCRSLLKKKLVDNKHTRWIQRQWEKHCVNPGRIKDKLIAKNFLGVGRRDLCSTSDDRRCRRHHLCGGSGDDVAMASRGKNEKKKKIPLAYSFISFKAGISTVDFKTKFLPADCVQAWKKWKTSRSLPLPFRRNSQVSAEAPLIDERDQSQLDRDGGGDGGDGGGEVEVDGTTSGFVQDHDTVLTDDLLTEQTNSSEQGTIQQSELGFGVVSASTDAMLEQEQVVEHEQQHEEHEQDVTNRASVENETVSAANHDEVGREDGASTDLDPISRKVDDSIPDLVPLEDNACCSSSSSSGISITTPPPEPWTSTNSQADPSSSSKPDEPRGRTSTRRRSPDLTAELSKYILFRELLRRMPAPDPATSSSRSDCSASVDEPEPKELQPATPSREQIKASKEVLSPYRGLFEDRHRDLLQELLTSLSEEAQLIRQAWNCSLQETANFPDQAAGAAASSSATAPPTPSDNSKSSEKEKERVSLFLSLKDGKIQLKEKPKEEMQHDSLSKVVKQHGMTTGFYMKITQEELLKKLPSRTRTRGRSVPTSRGRATTLQRVP